MSITGKAAAIAERMRAADVPVIGYVEKDQFWLDMRTVDYDELAIIERAAAASVSG